MSWNYAELSSIAKEYGGPEHFVKMLQLSGEKIGKIKMIPYLFAAFGGGCLVTNYIKNHYELNAKHDAEVISKETIQIIDDYNNNCSDEKQNDFDSKKNEIQGGNNDEQKRN